MSTSQEAISPSCAGKLAACSYCQSIEMQCADLERHNFPTLRKFLRFPKCFYAVLARKFG